MSRTSTVSRRFWLALILMGWAILPNAWAQSLPVVTLTATTPTASARTMQKGVITVARTGSTSSSLTVLYVISGTAGNGYDYEQLPDSITIAAGSVTTQIIIQPRINNITTNRTVVLTLKVSNTYALGSPSNAVVTILPYYSPTNLPPTNQPPTVRISSPANGATYTTPTNIIITAEASDPDGWVQKVEFFAGTQSLGVATNNPVASTPANPFRITWSNAPAGTYNLTAKATDNAGATATSTPIQITVRTVGSTSQLVITSPTNGASFTAPASIAIQATATDPRGAIYKVDFYQGNAKIGSSIMVSTVDFPPGTPVIHKFTWTNVVSGSYSLTAKATDSSGRDLTSPAVTMTVQNSTSLPAVTVSAIDPAAKEANNKTGTFTLSRTGATTSSLRVDYTLGGTAQNGVDYSSLPGYVTFAAGARATNVIVKPVENTRNNSDKYVLFTLKRGSLYAVGTPSNAVVTIEDKDLQTNTKPSCAITSPLNGATFTGPTNLTIRVSANDPDGWVQTMDFYQGTQRLGTLTKDFFGQPGTWTWTWTNAAAGDYTLTAKATDNRGGATTSSPVRITVQARVANSQIIINSPTNNASFTAPAKISIKATATDPRGAIYLVDFYQGDTKIGTSSIATFVAIPAGTPVQHAFDWLNVAAGNYSLTARGRDSAGNTVISSAVQIKVSATAPSSFVQRQLPSFYTPGVKLTVRLAAAPLASTGAYAVQDQPPTNWTIGAISDGGIYDTANRQVKFGLFSDHQARTLTYDVTPPQGETGVKHFTGLASADGVSSSIGGQDSINSSATQFHPADNNPADGRLTLDELTAYAAAWKNGRSWAVSPNPIPVDYVTRAGVLWRGGETYRYDATAGAPPLCWVNAPATPPHVMTRHNGLDVKLNSAVRRLLPANGSGQAMTLQITVAPQAGVRSYAVQEQVPEGWLVSEMSEGGQLDAVNHQVKWLLLDGAPRTLTYKVVPPAKVSGTFALSGLGSYQDLTTGLLGPIDGQQQITLGATGIVPTIITIKRDQGNAVQLTLTGVPGKSHLLEASGDLVQWVNIGSITPVVGQFEFTDAKAVGLGHRFYRVRLGPQ